MTDITIIDPGYKEWVKELSLRYRRSQIKAAVKVNSEMISFYWSLGKDIVDKEYDNHYGSSFYKNLASDLNKELENAEGLSERNLRYMKAFYSLYNQYLEKLPQPVAESDQAILPQLVAELSSIPWGHHRLIIDKCKGNVEMAIYYVHKVHQEGWSRDMLLNFISTDLYEREGKSLSNFTRTLPEPMSDLAQEITRDPYNFAFTGITGKYNETLLKKALVHNVTQFLLELGTGFAYVGKEHRLQIDVKEKFIDLLFYNLNLSCYYAVEVKIGEFDFQDMGQIQGYVVAVNHQLRKPGRDNPTIGILICKSKNNTLAQYALEGTNQPIAISEYELQKLYPEKVEGTIPTIAEIEDAIVIPDFEEASNSEKLAKTTQTAADTTQTSTQGATDTTQSTTQRDADTTQTSEGTTQSLTEMQNAILSILREEPTLGRKDIAQKIEGITEDGVKYHLQKLQKLGILRREGGDYGGHWVILR